MVKYRTRPKFVKMFQIEQYVEPPGRTKTTMKWGFITKSFTSHSKNGRPSVEAKPHKLQISRSNLINIVKTTYEVDE